jgi:hypothetical protein
VLETNQKNHVLLAMPLAVSLAVSHVVVSVSGYYHAVVVILSSSYSVAVYDRCGCSARR